MRSNNLINITVTASITALLIAGKWALAGIANVEIVSLLLAVFATVWSMPWALLASLVFVTVECLLWGFGTWVLSYLIHWPLLAILFCLAGRYLRACHASPLHTAILGTTLAVVATAMFGVLTSLVDVMLGYTSSAGLFLVLDDIVSRWCILYVRGIVYYVVHVLSNAVLFGIGYYPLCKAMRHAQQRITMQ